MLGPMATTAALRFQLQWQHWANARLISVTRRSKVY